MVEGRICNGEAVAGGHHVQGGVHRLFEWQAQAGPQRTAIEYGDEVISYAELDHRANRISRTLKARGVRPGDLVGLYHRKSIDLYAAILGILKVGAGYVPVDLRYPAERIEDIFSDADVRLILTSSNLTQRLPASGISRIELDSNWIGDEKQPAVEEPGQSAHDELASTCYVIYTSGSTGRPKGVRITHRNVRTFVASLPTNYRITPDDRIYQGFSTAFDASVEEIWAAFSTGATLCVPAEEISRSPADAATFINDHRITFFSTVPTFLSMVSSDLPSVRTLVLGGEACPADLVTRWASNGRRMLNTYGPTETTVVATMAECTPGQPVTIGRPLPGYETCVVDEHLCAVPAGTHGELLIGGDAVASGYLNREALTAEKFIPNPITERRTTAPIVYRTHDLVCELPDGNIQFLGRIDNQVKIRGFRVELQEIESVLLDDQNIRGAAVKVVDVAGLPEIAAYVVVASESLLDREELASRLRTRLPDYMIPRFLDVVPSLPVTTSGKIDRANLPAPVSPLQSRTQPVELAASKMEQRILCAWKKYFPNTRVSVLDDFFLDLGGHSLLAAQVATEMRSGQQIPNASVVQLYTFRTIRALAAHLGEWQAPESVPDAEQTGTGQKTQAERVFDTVPAWIRYSTVAAQAMALLVYHSIQMTPVVFLGWLAYGTMEGTVSANDAIWYGTITGFLAWPAMLLTAIGVKWLVIGRFRAGRYPVWGFYYCRWWIANLFQQLSWSHMFTGTPLMSLYFRALGANVGPHCTIMTPIGSAWDMVSIGANSSIGTETHLSAYAVENGWLHIGRIDIGKRCFVGTQVSMGLNSRLEDDVWIDDLSQVPDGVVIPLGTHCQGVPLTTNAAQPRPVQDATPPKPILYGTLHLLLIYVMGYVLMLAALPGLVLAGYAMTTASMPLGLAAMLAIIPVSIAWYALCVIGIKKMVIGTIKPVSCSVYSPQYLRLWFHRYLMSNTRHILMPLYATLYLPWFYRQLGARIGSNAEISTLNEATPDLLEIGEGSFLADECIIGPMRVQNGVAELLPVRIGNRSFIGNSAQLKGGTNVGDGSLLALMSLAPDADTLAVGKGQWLGSPAFPLPRPEPAQSFSDAELFAPPLEMVRKRYFVDAVRVVLPSFIWLIAMQCLALLLTLTFEYLPLWSLVLVVPIGSVLASCVEIGAVVAIKLFISGQFRVSVHPLWSDAVILDELVNGAYESLSVSTLALLQGTLFLAPALRLLGCNIGKWCFLDTTYFSEFDLVTIGNFTAINQGTTIQTHLFEDRVMKSGEVRIGNGCSIGSMSIVLYDTEIEDGVVTAPMSVVMKGEKLQANSGWMGIPCQRSVLTATVPGIVTSLRSDIDKSAQTQTWLQAAQ